MRIVRAARLLKQFGIEVDRTLVFPNVEVRALRNEPMLVLSLEAAREVRTRDIFKVIKKSGFSDDFADARGAGLSPPSGLQVVDLF